MVDDTLFEAAWRENRSYLVDLAYRMLRDIGDAEDVVQMAFSQLLSTGVEQIEDVRAWLVVVTSRLCLNRINSAQRRRERHEDPERLARSAGALQRAAPDPADRVTLDDRVRLALLVLLERLTPAERVVFVLHDVFATPFDAVAESVGRTPAACRQIARRARLKLEEATGDQRVEVSTAENRDVAERFIAACAGDNLEGLLAILDPGVSGDSDLGGFGSGLMVIARRLLYYWSGNAGNFWRSPALIVSQPIGDRVALLGYVERRLAGILMLDIEGGRVVEIHHVGQRRKLEFIDAQLR